MSDSPEHEIPAAEQSGNLPAIPADTAMDEIGREYDAEDERDDHTPFTSRPDNREPFSPGPEVHHPDTSYISGNINVAGLVRAQAEYIKRQTHFLQESARTPEGPDYLKLVVGYSLAQSEFIAAMQSVLHQLGII
jgi:hypothetical protein